MGYVKPWQIKLDMKDQNSYVNTNVVVNNANNTLQFDIFLYDNGEQLDYKSFDKVIIASQKSNGFKVVTDSGYSDGLVEILNDRIRWTISSPVLAVEGIVKNELCLIDNSNVNKVVATLKFNFMVQLSLLADFITDDSNYINGIEEVFKKTEELMENLEPRFEENMKNFEEKFQTMEDSYNSWKDSTEDIRDNITELNKSVLEIDKIASDLNNLNTNINNVTNSVSDVNDKVNNSMEKIDTVEERLYNNNLLINGNFDVWQRGDSIKVNKYGDYTADRWRVDSTTGVVISKDIDVPNNLSRHSMKITKGTDDNVFVRQFITSEIANLFENGKSKVTISFFIKGESGTIINTTFDDEHYITTTLDGTWKKVVKTVTLANNARWFEPVRNILKGNYVLLSQVKVELGEIATKFIPLNYGEELMRCKYFFERIHWGKVIQFGVGVVTASKESNDGSRVDVHTKVNQKRVDPTISISNPTFLTFRPGENKPMKVASFDNYVSSKSGDIVLNISIPPNEINVGTFGFLRANNETVYMDISAEV